MIKRIYLVVFLILNCFNSFAKNTCSLSSPTGKLKIKIEMMEKSMQIDLYADRDQIMSVRTLQFTLDKEVVEGNWRITRQILTTVDQSWQPVYGEQSIIPEKYNELQFFIESIGNKKELELRIRLYDEGLAFQTIFDRLDFWNRTLLTENTQFLFAKDCRTWATIKAQGLYTETVLSHLNDAVERPQVVEIDNHTYVAVGEAGLVDYARMKLKKSDSGYGLQSVLSGGVALELADYHSPWRYVMVGKHPGELVQNNYFILNLNEPNQIKNTSWIKPGKVIREVTLTTEGGLACVDWAACNQIEYVEFDAGWYGPENDFASNATTVTVDPKRSKGPLDLAKVVEYARSRGVGIILYVNMKALHNQLDEILPLYKKWGVKGVKYGFVDVGDQYSTAWLHHAVRMAAKYELMVDIHDEYRPTGYSRTYPNLMTQEGIRGEEETPSLEQTIYTLYNRMICGAGDYTNCYFARRVPEQMGGRAAQLAKRVAIYSPWQFIYWYDRPEKSPARMGGAGAEESVIIKDEVTDFYCSIPIVWDETKFLEGEMGKYAIVARRSGSTWYVSVLNAGDKRQVLLPLDMIHDKKRYKAVIYYQHPSKSKEIVCVKNMDLKAMNVLPIDIVSNSGCMIRFDKTN